MSVWGALWHQWKLELSGARAIVATSIVKIFSECESEG
jgi:hypothetical protein